MIYVRSGVHWLQVRCGMFWIWFHFYHNRAVFIVSQVFV